MLEPSYQQKQSTGLQWVLDELHPVSAYGRERLRTLRPYAPGQRAELEEELDALESLLSADQAFGSVFSQLRHGLAQVKDLRRTFARCRAVTLGEIELFEIKSFLLQLERAAPLARRLEEELGIGRASLEPCAPALALLDVDGRHTAAFSVSDRYSEGLAAVRREKKSIEEEIRRTGGMAGDEIEVRRTAVIAQEEREELAVREKLTEGLRPWLDALEEDAERIGRIDLLLEKARLARQWGGVRPELTGGSRICLKQMINPYVAQAVESGGGRFTPVDITLERGATVITGANMGGKSVALRAVVLNVLLAHMGFFPFAGQAQLPLLDDVFLIAEDGQSVGQGLSSFGAEIASLGQALESMQNRKCLLVLDEFARGTNPEEGGRIVRALVRYLNEGESIALLATHYDGAARFAAGHYQVAGLRGVDVEQLKRALAQNGGGMEAIQRTMDYRLLPVGAQEACPRDALTICRLLLPQRDLMEMIEQNY